MTTQKTADTLSIISTQIATANVSERVINVLVERELVKRTDILVKGLDKLVKLTNDLHKINRGDIETFESGEEGEKPTLKFSKTRREEIKKAKEVLGKLEKAIEKALSDKADFNDLTNLVKGE